EIAKVIVGQDTVLDHLLMALLCRGHVLMLGVPGLGKTLMARTISRSLEMEYRRIQFTPDLMPSDITGTDIIEEDPETGRRKLEFFSGPLFKAGESLRLQELVRGVPVADAVVRYAVTLVGASRPGYSVKQDSVHKYVRYGGSPRAAQYLILGAKARAILRGNFHVDFADVRAVAVPVLRHRLVLNFHARAEGVDVDTIINRLLKVVPEK